MPTDTSRFDWVGTLSFKHVSRLLRSTDCIVLLTNATAVPDMSSSWWEQVTNHASHGVRREGGSELWAERTLPQGLIAAVSSREGPPKLAFDSCD